MKINKVHITSDFRKSYICLPRNVQTLADKKDIWFKANPHDSRLKTHKLKGDLDGYWSYSVDYSHRIIFMFMDNNEAIYYDIGTHEIYR